MSATGRTFLVAGEDVSPSAGKNGRYRNPLVTFSEVYYAPNSHVSVAHFLGIRQLECQL